MRNRARLFSGEVSSVSGVHSAPLQRYDIGAAIREFKAGQSAVVVLESTTGNSDEWLLIATFVLDDGVEVTSQAVYIEHGAVRGRVVSKNGSPQIDLWLSGVQ